MLLRMADGVPITDIAALVGISRHHGYPCVQRLLHEGLQGGSRQTRPGLQEHNAPAGHTTATHRGRGRPYMRHRCNVAVQERARMAVEALGTQATPDGGAGGARCGSIYAMLRYATFSLSWPLCSGAVLQRHLGVERRGACVVHCRCAPYCWRSSWGSASYPWPPPAGMRVATIPCFHASLPRSRRWRREGSRP